MSDELITDVGDCDSVNWIYAAACWSMNCAQTLQILTKKTRIPSLLEMLL